MQFSAVFLAAALAVGQAAPPASVTLPNCILTLSEEAQVPAQEMGVLVELKVRDGDPVQAGQVLGQIDDIEAKLKVRVAKAKLEAANEKAHDDINVNYAKAAADVARAEYDVNLWANKKVPGSVPQVELNRLMLKCTETRLAIDKAKLEMRVATDEAAVAQAEADAAEEDVHRRQIRSPLNGVVRELRRHRGEWVQPGDQVLHVVRMDRLWVEGFVRSTDVARGEVQDRPATVNVVLARGRHVALSGKVVFVKPTTEAGDTFLVRAEIANQKESDFWILSPGLGATMTIQLR